GNGCAVTDDIAGKVPFVAEVVFEQHGVGAGGSAVDGVVGAYHGLCVSFGDGGAEGRQVGVFEIVCGDVDVGLMTRGLGTRVHGEVVGVGALHACDEGDGHAACEEWVFTIGFLAAAPARVAEDVNVGCPEGEA